VADYPNIVMVVLDTMRRDVLAAHGGKADTPYLDQLAADGVRYPRCIASSPWTVPSHASLFTGMNPSRHGVHETWDTKGAGVFGMMTGLSGQSLPVYLSKRGYNCVGYSANANIAPGSGFDVGFHSFTTVNLTNPTPLKKRYIAHAKRFGSSKRQIAGNLLKGGRLGEAWSLYRERSRVEREDALMNYPTFKGGDRIANSVSNSSIEQPFFLFVNLMEMHEPYLSGQPGEEPRGLTDLFGNWSLTPQQADAIRRKYVAQAHEVDAFVGQIARYLKDAGVYDESMVVAVSDHGQSLKENGFYGHGTFLYDQLVQVPLIVKYPKGARPDPPEGGYQTLAGVPEVVKDSLVGIADGSGLAKEFAISESYGINFSLDRVKGAQGFEQKREAFDRPRKAAYKSGRKLVVDGKTGKVLEFSKGGAAADPGSDKAAVKELLECMKSSGDKDFDYGEGSV
jgi:arylsulfatase A-like enzyme